MSDSSAVLTTIPAVPDFLGKAARVESVSSLIQRAQEQVQHLEHIMILNGQTLDDPISVDGGGDSPTYRSRLNSLGEGISALMSENSDIFEELIGESVQRRKQVERQIEKSRQE